MDVAGCGLDVRIANIDFDGNNQGIVGGIISLLEVLLQDTAEDKLGSTVCNELRRLD